MGKHARTHLRKFSPAFFKRRRHQRRVAFAAARKRRHAPCGISSLQSFFFVSHFCKKDFLQKLIGLKEKALNDLWGVIRP